MDVSVAKAVTLVSSVLLVIVPAFAHRQRQKFIARDRRKEALERILLTVVSIAFFPAVVWMIVPVFAFADYPLRPLPLFIGVACLAIGLWLLFRSHVDLGKNWSITLAIRENHELQTQGVYRQIRHPMYAALLLYAIGQMLVLPNWIAGPSYLLAIVLLVALRLNAEEQMMLARFGAEYRAYKARTKRFVPSVW
jgi:protein-S-isoprenylcysteine O-methyltransferase Ste14